MSSTTAPSTYTKAAVQQPAADGERRQQQLVALHRLLHVGDAVGDVRIPRAAARSPGVSGSKRRYSTLKALSPRVRDPHARRVDERLAAARVLDHDAPVWSKAERARCRPSSSSRSLAREDLNHVRGSLRALRGQDGSDHGWRRRHRQRARAALRGRGRERALHRHRRRPGRAPRQPLPGRAAEAVVADVTVAADVERALGGPRRRARQQHALGHRRQPRDRSTRSPGGATSTARSRAPTCASAPCSRG